jgi:hypothetical protein
MINNNLYNLIRRDHAHFSLVMFDPVCRSWRLSIIDGHISDGFVCFLKFKKAF